VGASPGDLLLAGVGGDDGVELGGKPEGCLPVAGGAVPGEVVGGHERGEVLEEGVRVGGAVRPVAGGMAGEVVGEGHGVRNFGDFGMAEGGSETIVTLFGPALPGRLVVKPIIHTMRGRR
jgi:hypothetical protein